MCARSDVESRAVRVRGEDMHLQPELGRSEREHAAELAAAEDAEGAAGGNHRISPRSRGARRRRRSAWPGRRRGAGDGLIAERQDGGGEERRVDGAGAPDREGADRDAGRHLHDRIGGCPGPTGPSNSTGTPKTGRGVSAAAMPGRWAAPPAPAMMTLKPSALAPFAKATSRSGVRCAETIRASKADARGFRAYRRHGASSPSRTGCP